jgi:D-alanine-D-alanine ligase
MKITVLMGGTSSERNVSLASGIRIVEALRSRGHTVTALDPAKGVINATEERALLTGKVGAEPPSLESLSKFAEGAFLPNLTSLKEVKDADVAFLALHGGQGEDGTIQALLDMAHVKYTGSGHLSSALAMDKDLSKKLFREAKVKTADWLMAPVTTEQVEGILGLPVVVKPSKQGSTVGLTLVKKREDLAPAIEEAGQYDDEVMIERFIPGRELTVGILGEVALPVGEILAKHEIYDYECKYTAGMATEEFPAKLSREATEKVQQQAVAAFKALKLRGYARIDFRLTSEGEFYCLEANAMGISFPELCERIVRLALG